jgi:hypothetical protein
MGKQTRYHPVSLAVIHGAAEFAGFKLGKLRQVDVDEAEGMAQYIAPILQIPKLHEQSNPKLIQHALDSAFSSDVGVLVVWITRRGNWMCQLEALSGAALEKGYSAASKGDLHLHAELSDIPF